MDKIVVVQSARKGATVRHFAIDRGWSSYPLCGKMKSGHRRFPGPDSLANCGGCIAEARAQCLDVDQRIEIPARVRSLVDFVRDYAQKNYDSEGTAWDVVVEAYSDLDIADLVKGCRSDAGAIRKVGESLSIYTERRAHHRSEVEAAVGTLDDTASHYPSRYDWDDVPRCSCGREFPNIKALDLHCAEKALAAGSYDPQTQGYHPDGSYVSWVHDEHGGEHWATRTWPGKVGQTVITIEPTQDGYAMFERYTPGWRGAQLRSPNLCDGPIPF